MDERAPNEYQRLRSTHQITVNEVQNQHLPIGVFSSALTLTFFHSHCWKVGKSAKYLSKSWNNSSIFRSVIDQAWISGAYKSEPKILKIFHPEINLSIVRPENICTISFCSNISACLSLLFAVSLLESNSIQKKINQCHNKTPGTWTTPNLSELPAFRLSIASVLLFPFYHEINETEENGMGKPT